MADEKAKTWYGEIEETITDTIKENHKRDITAGKLQGVLLDIVDLLKGKWLFGGVVQPSSQVDITGDVPVFYLAFTSGTYTNFGNNSVAEGEFALFMPNLSGNWDVHKWGIGTLLDGKVDKVEGKVLSENDYTDEDKGKVDALPDNVAGKSGSTFPEGNFASFDASGNLQNSGCNEGTFIKGVQKNGTDLTPDANGKVNVEVQDGITPHIDQTTKHWMIGEEDTEVDAEGKDAYQVYAASVPSGTTPMTEAQWLDSLKGEKGDNAVNPFKGWYDAVVTGEAGSRVITSETQNLPANPVVGDYAYVKTWEISGTAPSQTETPIVKIYECTTAGTWSDSGRTADTSNVQTFASGEEVNEVHIVNDLNTGGVGDVASAETVKDIADKTMAFVESLNILNPDAILNYRVNTDGSVKSKSSYPRFYGCTTYIEIGDGVICNHSLNKSGTIYRGAAVYDANKLFIGMKSTSNDGDPLVITKDMTEWTETPASGADTEHPYYVIFNLYNPASVEGGVAYDGVTDGYAVYRGTTLPTTFQPWFESYWRQKDAIIADNAVTTAKIADGAVTIDKVAFTTTEVGKNKLNPNTLRYGKAIDYTNGSLVTASDRYATDYIKVSELGLYLNDAPDSPGVVNMGYAVYGDAPGYQYIRGNKASSGVAIYTYQEGDKYVRFTVKNYNANSTYIIEGTSPGEYTPYVEKEVIDPDIIPVGSLSEEEIDQIKGVIATEKIFTDKIDVLLPQKFYCVKGDALQLFYKGMVKAIGLANRYVKPTCSVGTPYHRYLEIPSNTAAAVGNRELSVTIYDDNENVIGGGTSVIQVVNAPQSPASEKHVLCLGASTTAGGKWPCECQRRLLASDGTPQGNGLTNIRFVGSISKTLYGQTAYFFAKSGWSWYDYCTEGRGAKNFRFYLSGSNNDVNIGNVYTNNSYSYTVVEINTIDGVETILCETSSASNLPQSSGTLTPESGAEYPSLTYTSYEQDSANPFWDSVNDKLSFKPYVDTYCDGSIDMVYILLAANRLFTDSVETTKGYIQTFVEQLHTEYPNCIVVLAASMYPSMINMMPGYGASGNTNSNTYKTLCKEFALFSMYKEVADEYEYVEFESWSAQSDSDYNYPLTMKNVNTRNSTKQEPYANNTVHPGDAGYMQYADAAYRSIVAHLCQ